MSKDSRSHSPGTRPIAAYPDHYALMQNHMDAIKELPLNRLSVGELFTILDVRAEMQGPGNMWDDECKQAADALEEILRGVDRNSQ